MYLTKICENPLNGDENRGERTNAQTDKYKRETGRQRQKVQGSKLTPDGKKLKRLSEMTVTYSR